MTTQHVLVVIGTRPEAIKQAPVVWAMRERPDRYRITTLSTGQHREMLAPMLDLLELTPDVELDLMRPDQTLADITGRCMRRVETVLEADRPDVMVVQGDTTTAMAAALAAFYRGIPVAHVEAGLRSGSLEEPFPEEANRRFVDLFARWLFAPTAQAVELLRAEGVADERIELTGNTVVDALRRVRRRLASDHSPIDGVSDAVTDGRRRMVLVTCHRREAFGEGIASICDAIRALALANPDHEFVYPVHLNPSVQGPVRARLAGMDNVRLLEPQPYDRFLRLLSLAHVVLTDSGGVQEEAPSFDVPVVVMRNRTERPEGLEAGCALLVGTERQAIVQAATRILRDPVAHAAMSAAPNPYGDGTAGQRIADALDPSNAPCRQVA